MRRFDRALVTAGILSFCLACAQQASVHAEGSGYEAAEKSIANLRNERAQYPGIPSPSGRVPSAIMPVIPSGADRQAFPYDPINVSASTPKGWPGAESRGAYYIDRFSPDATDENNAFGFPAKPRKTIPFSAYGAAVTYVEIHGNHSGYVRQSPQYKLGRNEISNIGAADSPVIWKCVDDAWLGAKIDILGKHIIFDGCNFQNEDDSPSIPHITVGPGAQYVTIRNGILRGQGTPIGGGTGQMINIAGRPDAITEFVVIYNNTISEGGDWTADHKKDIHAIRPLYWSRYIWVLNNDLSHVQGDLVQTGNSSNRNSDPAQRSHYIYIAGNHMYEAFENALDNKNSYHVILSSNTIHNFGNARTGTAVILSNNDEGRFTGYHWAIANEIYDVTGGAIRFSGDQDGERSFAVGNYIHGVDDGIRLADHSGAVDNDAWVIGNTVRDCTNRAIGFGRGAGQNLYIRSNRTINCRVHLEDRNKFVYSELSGHVALKANGKRIRVSTRGYNSQSDNSLGSEADGDGARLLAGDAVFPLFKSLYGVDLSAEDLLRPALQ